MSYIIFSQSTGSFDLFADDGVTKLNHIGDGWAGHGEGKNNPAMQGVVGVGPLPRGDYHMSEPFDHPHCGPYVIRLTPMPGTEMFGRDGFLIHGAATDPAKRGSESNGCAILGRVGREAIVTSRAPIFRVVE